MSDETETTAQDPGVGEMGTAVGSQLGETPLHQGLDGRGHARATQLGHCPCAVDELERLGLPIGPGQLLDEERDTLGASVDALQGGGLEGTAEKVDEQLLALAGVEPLETEHLGDPPHPVEVGDQLGGTTGGRVGVGPETDQQEHRGRAHGSHQIPDQLDAVVVGPLQVVEHEEQGALPGEGEQGGRHLVELAQHLLLWGEALQTGAPARYGLLSLVERLHGHRLPSDCGHGRRGEQSAEEQERPSKLLVGGHLEDPER